MAVRSREGYRIMGFLCPRMSLAGVRLRVMAYRYRMCPGEGAERVMRDLHCAHARYVWNLACDTRSHMLSELAEWRAGP